VNLVPINQRKTIHNHHHQSKKINAMITMATVKNWLQQTIAKQQNWEMVQAWLSNAASLAAVNQQIIAVTTTPIVMN